jgi:hypothetical protein
MTQILLPVYAARAECERGIQDMFDLFAHLATVTNYLEDGVRLSVAFLFDDVPIGTPNVVLGSLGDAAAVHAQRNDAGAFKLTANHLHVLRTNERERARLSMSGSEHTDLFARTGSGDVTTLSGFLGDVRLAEIATRIPEVRTVVATPGDVIMLTTSGFFVLEQDTANHAWSRFLARCGKAAQMLHVLRHPISERKEDVTVALGYALP